MFSGNQVCRLLLLGNYITKDFKIGESTDESVRKMVKFLINHRGLFFMYGLKYVACNVLGLVTIILALHMLNVSMDYQFLK